MDSKRRTLLTAGAAAAAIAAAPRALHIGVEKFMVMGFHIGGPFIWNLLKRAHAPLAA
jgi:dienelactone hydrolase